MNSTFDQLHALAYNLGNFLRTLATPEPIKDWSLASLKEKLIKIGAKIVSHGLNTPNFIVRSHEPGRPKFDLQASNANAR
jgi:hypothetical protein